MVMLRFTIKSSWAFALVLVAAFAAGQNEFSGDIVDTGRQGAPTQAKIYVGKSNIRIEPQKSQMGMMGGAVIVNMMTQTSTVLLQQQRMYMELPMQIANRQNPWKLFRTADPENACPDWLQLPQNHGATCHKLGSDTVNGRHVVKYEGTNSDGQHGTMWVDPKLHFPVKWQDDEGNGGELRNIQEGSQASSLFELPAGFTKMDMSRMIQMQQMQRPQ
jgi:hypothetical protein